MLPIWLIGHAAWGFHVSTAAHACFESLRQAILKGRYVPGERLPPERQLADTLGVGRVTLLSKREYAVP